MRPPKHVPDDLKQPKLVKRRQRPPRQLATINIVAKAKSDSEKSMPVPTGPQFNPFLCEWRDCKAELQNLETLRNHIFKVHTKLQRPEGLQCSWGKCGLMREVEDELAAATGAEDNDLGFTTLKDFKNHVEKAHITPFAWHMGDGPQGSILDPDDSDRPAYLSDAMGN